MDLGVSSVHGEMEKKRLLVHRDTAASSDLRSPSSRTNLHAALDANYWRTPSSKELVHFRIKFALTHMDN